VTPGSAKSPRSVTTAMSAINVAVVNPGPNDIRPMFLFGFPGVTVPV